MSILFYSKAHNRIFFKQIAAFKLAIAQVDVFYYFIHLISSENGKRPFKADLLYFFFDVGI
jgi:hypothetical protein